MHLTFLRHAGLAAARILMMAAWFGLSVWAAGVVFYNVWGGPVLVWLYVAAMACAFALRGKRPVLWCASWGVPALLLAYYLCIPATNDKEWQPSWSRLPSVEINGNEIVVKDVRSFIYRTERDFDARYVTRRFDLDKLATLDFAVSHWDGMEFVAHTMLSFGFEDGKHLALSVETRLPEGVEQGSVPGLYKQFNVIYILADEEDLFALRTNYRKEDMYLYRINIDRENLKKAFLGFAEKINSLHERPRYYHTVTANCTTELVDTFKNYLGVRRWQWTPVFNGMCDQNAYDRGELLHLPGESFRELKKRSFMGHGGNGEGWPALRRRWEEGWRTLASAPVKE
ncbi:DUF4105 domain-containing protein [Akkermansia sp.]|uniref:Lnb N-terminal periplasmic domain-containing protein n=1 Tax=Akkermansia sp. TaxID=1872421 RepID=UPI0025BB8259|nr:DUF4105 domain-containing protein [Akkermansia sp.]MCD8272755.1 DUF4105 domain-containing protein [Akkermansia sp.]